MLCLYAWVLLMAIASAQQLEATIPVPNPTSITGNSDGSKVYVTSDDSDSLYIIDCSTNTVRAQWVGVPARGSMVYNPAANKLYCVCSTEATVAIIDAGPDTVLKKLPLGDYGERLLFNPACNRVYHAGEYEEVLTIIDGRLDGVLAMLNFWSYGLTGIGCDAVTGKVYCSTKDYHPGMLVIDGRRNTVLDSIPGLDDLTTIIVDTSLRRAYCFEERDDCLYVIDVDKDSFVVEMEVARYCDIEVAALDQARHRLYCAYDDTIVAIEGAANSIVGRTKVPEDVEAMLCDDRTGIVYFTTTPDHMFWALSGPSLELVGSVSLGGRTHNLYLSVPTDRIYVTDLETCAVYVIRCNTGIAENETSEPTQSHTSALVRGPLLATSNEPATVLDPGGRLVGVLDTEHSRSLQLPAGVYFVVGQRTGESQRVVVVR